jgi:hypothetical protein
VPLRPADSRHQRQRQPRASPRRPTPMPTRTRRACVPRWRPERRGSRCAWPETPWS